MNAQSAVLEAATILPVPLSPIKMTGSAAR